MLIEFRLANYRSFRDEQKLSLVASADQAHPENTSAVEEVKGLRLLRSAAVYGANASGKTNLMRAMAFVREMVRNSAQYSPDALLDVQPYLLDEESAQRPSTFEVAFVCEGQRYEYGFAIDSTRVHEEWLTAYPRGRAQNWFHRGPGDDQWYFGPSMRGDKRRLVDLVRPNVLFLSLAGQIRHEQLRAPHAWLARSLRFVGPSELAAGPLVDFTAAMAKGDAESRERVSRLLRLADLGIDDLKVEEKESSESVQRFGLLAQQAIVTLIGERHLVVETAHRCGAATPATWLRLEDESSGTQRLFAMAGAWLLSLENGWTLIVDEIDSSLHPLLVRALVSMFHRMDVNSEGGQLILSTHDVTLLDRSLLRRDQVWLVEKDSAGSSQLYSLLEFSPRKDEAIGRGYLQGRYGAIPFLGDMGSILTNG